MKLLLFLIMIALGLSSCQKEVELDQPSYRRKIVVDGYIETGRQAHVFLTLSSPYLTHYDSASIRETFLNYAKVTLTSSTGEEEVLTLFREDRFFPPFVYKSIAIKGQEGETYHLRAEVKGRIVTATTTIPQAVAVVDTRMTQISDTTGFVEFATNPPNEGSYYLFTRVKSRFADSDFHPSFNPLSRVKFTQNPPVWQRILRSSELGHYFSDPKSSFYDPYDWFEYDRRDTVEIIVGTVDSVSYRVIESLFIDRVNQENPFAFNGNRIETNIEGGIGRWTGIGITGIETIITED
ncbi:MAG: hypothetical protein JG782_543 [Anaerophaga sp.]|uniref:DUF4249 family protein n=1 Tax=Anaerophaga thermohalophila TaxID=177400 RepID=UPI001FDEC39B|nr:DUF4249 family protein [Anaerophaga thermohalophila]MBZ4675924.1 hypothetical protein [Anaerophaga sp.]MDI3520847.1 hypothetical protein [Anaerophaga sp.]MDK2841274.1 hypothetical protein [Anaerophaga sp.]MDN5291246.1 hypothetical protein [Anaerophaga sp.]